MKLYRYAFFLFVSLSLIGCLEESHYLHGEFVEMKSSPIIINRDTDEYSLLKYYDNYNIEDLNELSLAGDVEARYLKAVLYLADMGGYGVERDVDKGVSELESLWREGVVDAGFYLYLIHYQSSIGDDGHDISLKYLLASAEYGYPRSQQELGLAYSGDYLSELVDVDYVRSATWYTRAAEQGDKLSAINLSGLYLRGDGVDKNLEKSFEWISKVEDLPFGHEDDGFYSLANFYEHGIGTDIDLVQAYKYYDLLSPGSAPDKARIEEKMTPEQIREAIRLSRQWQEEHNIFVSSYYGLEYQEDGTFQ